MISPESVRIAKLQAMSEIYGDIDPPQELDPLLRLVGEEGPGRNGPRACRGRRAQKAPRVIRPRVSCLVAGAEAAGNRFHRVSRAWIIPQPLERLVHLSCRGGKRHKRDDVREALKVSGIEGQQPADAVFKHGGEQVGVVHLSSGNRMGGEELQQAGGDISAGPEERGDGSVGLVQPLGLEKPGYRTVMEFNDNCNEYRIMLEWRISLCK